MRKTTIKKKKKKWIVQGYYIDRGTVYTILANSDNTLEQKYVKGVKDD